ncbi:MAG TPA: ferredoxin [Clostridia bacterium]|nr:ferredoxin [Clostridia bacterium]
MKVTVNVDDCIGCGLCKDTCCDVFIMDGDKATVINNSVNSTNPNMIKDAAQNCPVNAIEVID